MTDFLNKLTGDELIPIVAILSTFLFLIVYAIASNWRKARIAEIDAALKRDLIGQGRSAEEIDRIIGSGKKKDKATE